MHASREVADDGGFNVHSIHRGSLERRTFRLRSSAARATAARREGGYRTAHGTRRQVFFSSRGGFSVPRNHRRDGLISREDGHVLSIPGMRQRTDTTEVNDLGNQAALPAESSARWASTVVRRTTAISGRKWRE